MDSIERLAALIEQLGGIAARLEQVSRAVSFVSALHDATWASGYQQALQDFPRRRKPSRRRGDGPDLKVVN